MSSRGITLSWVRSPVPSNLQQIIDTGVLIQLSNSVIWTEKLERGDPLLRQLEKILLRWATDMAQRYRCEPPELDKNTQLIYREGKSERFHNQLNSYGIQIVLKKRA